MGSRVLEFRAMDDEAWYSVKVELKGDTLLIEFQGILETAKFVASNFDSDDAIELFIRRFRMVSPQLQDSECGKITKGSIVCAACHAFGGDDMRYYDAVVEAVDRRDHSFVNGEDECLCTFVLCWIHGPKTGLLTDASIIGLCTVKDDGQVDPKIASFSKLAKSILASSRKNTAKSEKQVSAGSVLPKEGRLPFIDPKTTSFQDIQNQWNLGYGARIFCNYGSHQDQEKDLGGETSNTYFVLIGNLERTLSPSSIQRFLHKQTDILSQVYILLSPVTTPFAKAVIVLDTKKKQETLCQFLDSPNYFVVSVKGRPWVVIETVSRHGMQRTSFGNLIPKSQGKCEDSYQDDELMIVRSGSDEYMRAKRLRDLFVQFIDHEQLLLRRFVEEERMIYEEFSTV